VEISVDSIIPHLGFVCYTDLFSGSLKYPLFFLPVRRRSASEDKHPAGLSHRLKPARRAALAVEKVTAVGRLQEAGRVAGAVSLRSYLVLEKRAMLFSSQSHNVVLWNNHILGI